MAEQPSNVDYLTAIRPVLPYLRDSGGTAEWTTGPVGNIYQGRLLILRQCVTPQDSDTVTTVTLPPSTVPLM